MLPPVKKIAFALLLGAAFVAGCGDKAADGKDAKSASAASSGEAKKDDKAGGGGDTGIKECDDYIAALLKCDKMPAESKKAVEDSKAAWKQAASGPGKDAIASTCKQSMEAVKAACP